MPHALPPFFTKGQAADLILLVILAEFTLLSAVQRYSHAAMISRVFAFAPGVCLLLALRSALTSAGWAWIALFLTASFPFHLGDLMRRRLR